MRVLEWKAFFFLKCFMVSKFFVTFFKYCIVFLLQGPTGVSGPKGARGAQGPAVSNISHHISD